MLHHEKANVLNLYRSYLKAEPGREKDDILNDCINMCSKSYKVYSALWAWANESILKVKEG